MKKALSLLKNKYFLATLFFAVWLLFFDRYDLVSQFDLRDQLFKLRQEKNYYTNEIKTNQKAMQALISDSANLEKFAREKYLMKEDDEDIFVIVTKTIENDTNKTR
jgi:hypothetical protein